MDCSTPGLPVHHQLLELLLKLVSIESVMPSNHLILCHPLLLLPSIFPSIKVSSNESVLCIRWPKYWSFSLSISPSKEIPGLIFRMDWLDLLAVQGTVKSLLQHHISKASVLWCSALPYGPFTTFITMQIFFQTVHWLIEICTISIICKVYSLSWRTGIIFWFSIKSFYCFSLKIEIASTKYDSFHFSKWNVAHSLKLSQPLTGSWMININIIHCVSSS